jgi:hypothetical protein
VAIRENDYILLAGEYGRAAVAAVVQVRAVDAKYLRYRQAAFPFRRLDQRL